MSARPEADPQLGRTLGGQYRIEALLGAGGMGRVYRGRQLSVNRPVAIKVIAGQAPHPREWVQRFRREAEATASLSHPNSVRLFDFGVTESEELFMVMELLEGNDLARQLQAHGPLPLVAALAIARQVLLALCEAHALGITHRDIKPDNIFLASVRGADVVAKVMDFGIAGIAQAQRKSRLTGAGMIIGTPMYMSPEQAQGLRVDGKSDVYSLGVVLFEMLTGRPVFESHTAVTLLLAHVARAPMRLEEAGLKLREQSSLQTLLDRLLAKDPNERPSAAEALDTVTAISTRLGIAGATGSMRALDIDATALPKAAARRGRSSSAALDRASQQPLADAPPPSAAFSNEDHVRPASAAVRSTPPPTGARAAEDPALRGSAAQNSRAGRHATPPLAALAVEAPGQHGASADHLRSPRNPTAHHNAPDAVPRALSDESSQVSRNRTPPSTAFSSTSGPPSAARSESPGVAAESGSARNPNERTPPALSDAAAMQRGVAFPINGEPSDGDHALERGQHVPTALGADGNSSVRDVMQPVAARNELAAPPAAAGSVWAFDENDVAGQPAAELLLEVDDAGLARNARQFQRAHVASAPTRARLRPGFALLGTCLVVGAASALALRWAPTLIEAARPATAMITETTPPVPAQEQRTVLINSQPSGATVLVEGEKLGVTPIELKVRGETEISVSREGYVRQLVQVPYDARAPLLVKLAVQPVDKPKARAPSASGEASQGVSLRRESNPRVAARVESDKERRDRSAQSPATVLAERAQVDRADESLPRIAPRADSDHERRDRSAQSPAAALAERAQVDRADESLPRIAPRADSDRERRDRSAQSPAAALAERALLDSDKERRDRSGQAPAAALANRTPGDRADESLPRIAPRADSDHERRDRSAQSPAAALAERALLDSDKERRDRSGQAPAAALADRTPGDRADESLPRIAPRADSDHERRDRGGLSPAAALAERELLDSVDQSAYARFESATGAAVPTPAPIEQVDPEPGVYRLAEQPEHDSQSAGLDVERVLQMGREGDSQRSAGAARSARALERQRVAELASEHGGARDDVRKPEEPLMAAETSRSAATRIEAIREDEVAEIALDDDERAHVAQHYGLRAIGRAVARAFGRLLIPYPNRDRRAALARMPLMYPSFREARAAYKARQLNATSFQEAVWQLRERRRQRIWTERDRYARGELSQGQYEAKVDRIWDEFWGQR